MNRNLLNEANGTVGNRIPSGWKENGGLYWKSFDLGVGKDWIALQVNANIVEQAIVGCLFANTGDRTMWLKESYDILIADKWVLVSNNGGVWVLVKGDRMVSGVPAADKDVISASVIFMSASKVSVGYTGAPTWTAVDLNRIFGSGSIRAITYGNGKYVAVGDDGKMATSTDGVTWTAVANNKFGKSHIRAVAFGNNRFVAGGDETIAYSTDGVTWTAVIAKPSDYIGDGLDAGSAKKPFFAGVFAIIFAGGKFVAGCAIGRMAISTDGITWTAVPRENTDFGVASIFAIAYGNGKFVAVGDSNYYNGISTSTNGTKWTAVKDSKFGDNCSFSIRGVAFGGNRFVAGSDNGKISTSTDGVNWTAIDVSRIFNSEIIFAITYGNGKFIAGGTSGKMAVSTDGLTWLAVTDHKFGTGDNSIIYTIAYVNNRFIAGGAYGRMAYLQN